MAAVGAALAGGILIGFGQGKPSVPVPAYEAARVIDGDTFETKEGLRIRLASSEAPALDLCAGKEAKEKLEELILNKTLYLKVTYFDTYRRLVSLVYTDTDFVNEMMLSSGNAYYSRSTPGAIGDTLKLATAKAREEKKGLFSESCTQTVNAKNKKCDIKGNTSRNGKIYYLPECGVYPNVELQLYLGDQWFCSESQAKAAGFRPPEQCP